MSKHKPQTAFQYAKEMYRAERFPSIGIRSELGVFVLEDGDLNMLADRSFPSRDQASTYRSRVLDKAAKAVQREGRKANPTYVDRLVKHYGVTDAPSLGGYLLPDGRFLDFSEGSGTRAQDHRNITWVLPANWEGPRDTRWDGLVRVAKKVGMYRWMPETWSLEAWTPPTPEQASAITSLADDQSLTVEAHSDKRDFANTYEPFEGREAREDLRRFFQGGSVRRRNPALSARDLLRHKIGMNSLSVLRRGIERGTVYHGQMADGMWASVGPYTRAVGRPQYAVFLRHARVESSDPTVIAAAFRAMVMPATIRTSLDKDRLDNPAPARKPMDTAVAALLIETAEQLGVKSTVTRDQAERIIHVWLRARGLERDRWGNYQHRSGDRYHFGKANLQRQAKSGSGWVTLTSTPYVDAATNLLRGAGEATGKLKWIAMAEKRKVAKGKAADRAADKQLRAKAAVLSMKALAYENPKHVAANLRHETLSDATYAALSAKAKELTETMYQLLKAGAAPPQDSQFASVDRPPVAAVYTKMAHYLWTETVDGVAYTIEVKNHEPGAAEIHIGKSGSGFGLAVSAFSMGVSFMDTTDSTGDAYVSGKVVWNAKLKSHLGSMFLITSQEKRKGAGSRVLDLWCRMMNGYGSPQWVAQAVGEEGMAFLKARAKAGKITLIAKDGSNLLVECGSTA